MGLKKDPHRFGVNAYFINPISNQNALKCYGDVDNSDYSGFNSNLQKYLNEKSISEMIKVNSEIQSIFKKFKISIKVNVKILNSLVKNHLPQTRNIALGIADCLPEKFKPAINKKALAEATFLHDIAKVIIPENIVNKAGTLTENEREIMQEHAKLSYEMLKTTDLTEETLNLVKNHHNADKEFVSDINLQILSIADIYSALREKRSYKDVMNKEQALSIINKEMEKRKFYPCVYNALVEYAEKGEKIKNFSIGQKFYLNRKNYIHL